MHGQFVWYELMTSDSSAAKSFYPRLTGWGTEEWDRETYSMWTVNGEPMGGIVQLRPHQLDEGMRPNWLPYVEVTNVDEAAARVGALGGMIVFGPKDIAGTGRFAVAADPQGAAFAIYTPLDRATPFEGTRHVGRFVWHELVTTDPAAAWEFYRQLFGWEHTSQFDMGQEMGVYQMFGHGSAEYGGMYKRSWQWGDAPPQWICYAHVRDVRKATTAAARLGANVMIDYMEIPGGDIVGMITDPQGAVFALHQSPLRKARASRKAAPSRKKPATPARKKAAKPTRKKTAKAARKKPAKANRTKPRKATPKKSGKSRRR